MTLLEQFRAACVDKGTQLTVTRRAATQGGAVTTQSIYFIVKRMRDFQSLVSVEGLDNAAAMDPHIFTCVGDADVDTAVDRIMYKGAKYRITLAQPQDAAGVTIALHCHAVKTGT